MCWLWSRGKSLMPYQVCIKPPVCLVRCKPNQFRSYCEKYRHDCTQFTMSCWIVEFKLISRLPHMFFEQGMHKGLINGYDSVNEPSMILPRYEFALKWCKFMRNPAGVNHHLFDKKSSVSMTTLQEWKMVVGSHTLLAFYVLTFRNKTISILIHIHEIVTRCYVHNA